METRSLRQAKSTPKFTAAVPQNTLKSRPFAQPTPANPVPILEDMQVHLEHAQRFGHHLVNFANSQSQSITPIIQPKLTIGAPGDKYEQEADRVAQQVVQRIHMPKPAAHSPNFSQPASTVQRATSPMQHDLQLKPLVQREEISEENELQMKPILQRRSEAGPLDASTGLENAIQQSRGSGQPLADSIRQPMEHAFGNVDFSGVKVHTDAQSDQLNRSIQAKAFATGQDIFFRQGSYQPESQSGQSLIAHELTHVLQQNRAAVQRSIFIQRYTETHDGQYYVSENNQFAVSTDAYPTEIYTHETLPQGLKGGLVWQSNGQATIDNTEYERYVADISAYEEKVGKPGTEHFCGEFARGLTGDALPTEDQSTSDVGGILYDSDTTPEATGGPKFGWENHYASVVIVDDGDHATFETAVGIPKVWVGIYGSNRGQTFKYKTQLANLDRMETIPDAVLPAQTRTEKGFWDWVFCRPGREVEIKPETRIKMGITEEEATAWRDEMEAWRRDGTMPTSAYMIEVVKRLQAELDNM